MSALSRELAKLQQASTPQGGRQLLLLQAYAEHGRDASVEESLEFLRRLRKTRDELRDRAAKISSGPRMLLQRWRSDCQAHEGFALLRTNLLARERLEELSGEDLSLAYNHLRRMSLVREAEEVWPCVGERVAASRLGGVRELLGVWSVAPPDRLQEIDAPMASALAAEKPKGWQLLSAISRVADRPNSLAVSRCAEELKRRMRGLSPEDLAALVGLLGRRGAEEGAAETPGLLAEVAAGAKARLAGRDGALEGNAALEAGQLCGLLGAIEDRDDPLWPTVQRQLLGRKDLTTAQLLAVCTFVHRSGGSSVEPQLWAHTTVQLQKILNRGNQPGLVTLVAKSLDVLLESFFTCQSLLNSAIKLKEDLFPAALWTVFMRAGEVKLVERHKSLQVRLRLIGDVLEKHGIRKAKITLREMPDMVKAMGSNGVVLQQCLSQMTRRFVDMLGAARDQAPGGAPAPDGLQEDEEGPPAEGGAPRASLLGEVQALMLSYWIQLRALPVDDPELTSTVLSFCSAGGGCRMEHATLAHSVAELGQAATGPEAAAVQDGLIAHLAEQLPRMRRRELVRVATIARSVAIWHAVTAEVRRWLFRDGVATIATLRHGQDLDDLLAILARSLAWSQDSPQGGAAASGEDEGTATRELLQRIMHLAVDSLEHVSHKEPELARRRLVATVNTLSAFEQGVPLGSLSRCLHEQAATEPLWDVASAVEVAYSFSALHGGEMPFDVAARLWRLVGGALAEAKAELSDAELAKLWAFALAAVHLSSRSALAALRLAPEGPAVESYLLRKRLAKGQARFDLAREQQAVGSVASLRAGLPQALPGEVCLENHAVQGSPYAVDFALEGRKAVLVVARSVHRAADRADALSGPGRLMQRTLEALGWKVQWVWPGREAEALIELGGAAGGRSAEARDEAADEAVSVSAQ